MAIYGAMDQGDTRYNGRAVLKTPNLDQMAKEGIRFDRFYSGAAVCAVSCVLPDGKIPCQEV